MTSTSQNVDAASGTAGLDEAEIALLRTRLEKAVAKVCPLWMGPQADDLVQISMLRVLDIVAKSEEERSFNASYLYRVAYSALVDELRRVRWRREVPLESGPEEQAPLGASTANPEDRAAGREVGDEINACLHTLIDARRRAVVLYLHGHSASESAMLLRHGVKQVRNWVYRGLTDLRACLAKKGIHP